MTLPIYLIIGAITWIAALAWFMRNEAPPRPEVIDWAFGSLVGLCSGIFWPLVAVALIPIAIVKYLRARTSQ